MKKLRNLAFIDESVYERSSNRDKSLINTLALFVPISSLIAGLAFYYGIVFLIESQLVGIIVGFLVTYALFQHDRTLLDTFNNYKIIARVLLSIVIALVMAIPYKVHLSRESLTKQIQAEAAKYNADIEGQYAGDKSMIYYEEKELDAKITEAAEIYDRTGRSQQLVEARRERDKFLETKDERLAAIDEIYAGVKQDAEVSNAALAGVYLNNMFNTSSPSEMFINLFVFVMLLFLESMPAFSRLLLSNGDYLRIKEHLERIAIKADKSMWELDEQLMGEDGVQDLATILARREVYKVLKNEAKQDFTNTDDLIALMQKAEKLKRKQHEKEQPHASKGKKEQDFPEFEYDD